MNTLRQKFWMSLTPLSAGLTLAVAGCGGGGEEPAADSPDQPAETAQPVEVANPATIQGRVAFEGEAPELETIDMRDEPTCMEQHAEGPLQEEVIVSNGGLQNVFVYVKQGLEGQSFPASGQAVIDQTGCMYEPRVLGVQTGQDLIVRNSDGLLHNVNASPSENRGFNFSQPTSMEGTRSFNTPEVMIPVRCDVHGWMTAYIGVLEHPYYAVSSEDGSFQIPNLPPGEYVVEAWHERYGVQEMNVSVGPDETADANFTFNAQTAGNTVPMGEPIELHAHHAQP